MNRRILFVIESLFELGPMLQLRPLLSALQENGFETHIATLNSDPSNADTNLIAQIHCISHSNRPFNQAVSLRNLVSEIRPEIIHAWGIGSHNLTRMATIYIEAGNQLQRRLFSFFELPQSNSTWGSFTALMTGHRDDMLVVPHWSTKDDLIERGVKNNIEVVPNSIVPMLGKKPSIKLSKDESVPRRQLRELVGIHSPDVYLAGTVAKFESRYRLKDLVWAIDLLCCVRNDVHLFIFGTGCDLNLRRFISKTEAGSNIHLIPVVSTVQRQLSGLDFYWNAQLHVANPTAMLTAMSLRIPSVSVYGNETKDALLPLQSGLAANFGARDEFARWTKFLIEQNKRRNQIAEQGQAHAEANFPTREMTSGYLSLYA